ncbi:MAG: cytochrome c3 family protein [Desulfurivibrionaceae bacterium]
MTPKSAHIAATATFVFFLGMFLVDIGTVRSFHNGGVMECNGCHSMHNANEWGPLLLASDPSSVCLNCHSGTGGANSPSVFSADGSAMTPGGDFYWLNKTFTWSGGESRGESHGHNVVALDFGLTRDSRHVESPGGNYPSENLSCISCHDPHGKKGGGTRLGALPVTVSGSYGEPAEGGGVTGNYRLLGDSRYEGGSAVVGYQFSYDAPVARQNILKRFGESDGSHVDYGAGMSEWCGNCHGAILQDSHLGAGSFVHPAGSNAMLSSQTVSMYNTYINTGDLLANGTGTGDAATAYLQFVPFERGTGDSQLLDPASTQGPDTNSTVMCLTCHRAHGSAFRSAGRWDFDAVLLAESHPGPGDGGVSGNDVLYSYYNRDISIEFGPGQGQFCEKCHGA